MPITLPDLPYGKEALKPYLSEETMNFHYGKHHKAYVTNLNKLIENTDLAQSDLDFIILKTEGDAAKVGIFNNAAQVWNHSFFWNSMKPNGGGEPSNKLMDKIKESFGSLDAFKEQFKQAGITQFGSGWVWLVDDHDILKIVKTSNAMTPIAMGLKPLMTCDVWEHAYYLDYQNRRPDFLQTFLDSLVNWDFVESNL